MQEGITQPETSPSQRASNAARVIFTEAAREYKGFNVSQSVLVAQRCVERDLDPNVLSGALLADENGINELVETANKLHKHTGEGPKEPSDVIDPETGYPKYVIRKTTPEAVRETVQRVFAKATEYKTLGPVELQNIRENLIPQIMNEMPGRDPHMTHVALQAAIDSRLRKRY